MLKKNPQSGIATWVILLALLLVACVPVISYEITRETEPSEISRPTQEQSVIVQPTSTEWAPKEVPEERIDLSTIVQCRHFEVGDRIPRDHLRLEEFGFALSYPPGWYYQTFLPGEWIGSGDPGPEYLAAFSNVPNNFDPGYSRGSGGYDDQTGVVQMFVYRWPKESGQDIYEATGVSPSNPNVFQFKTEDWGFEGFVLADWSRNYNQGEWTTYYGGFDLGNFGLTIETKVWGSEPQLFRDCWWEGYLSPPAVLNP